VQSISADDEDLDPQSFPKLKPGVQVIRFAYTAPSLSMPEKVVFRYRLDGVDRTWESADSRRQASYTNLAPGSYTFRVMAANEDGIWSKQEAVSRFVITPHFYQTVWFKLLMAVVALLIVWLLFLLRLRQLHQRLRLRMAEREELSRELHDTLLQGIGSVGLHMQLWAEDSQLTDNLRREIAKMSQYVGEMMIEGRDRISSLRATDGRGGDLIADIQALTGPYTSLKETTLTVRYEGTPRALSADVARGVVDINREGVRNAFTHAAASAIEVVICYDDRSFTTRVVDNGKGIPSDILAAGARPGHWGVAGMFERSKKIGAALAITKRDEGGTALSLVVPAHRAYVTIWARMLTILRARD
jgi:signal transduction histidine kinase